MKRRPSWQQRPWILVGICVAVAVVTLRGVTARSGLPDEKEPMLAHIVFFSLKDSTTANRQKLVDACHKYLSDHPGVVFYAAGPVSDLERPVNDRDFDVGLHVVFADRASHDAYQSAETHLKFIEENKDTWDKVRVFDSDVTAPVKAK